MCAEPREDQTLAGCRVHSVAPQRLSLCMIVRDEEEFLDACLQSVEGVVDEIVVVDTGSTDRSVDIAARRGATVVPFRWCDDFSAARNESLNHASGEWILVLDADERLLTRDPGEIRSLLAESSCGAYTVTITGQHRHAGGLSRQINAFPRLFRRRPGIRFEGNVHEQITPSIHRLHLPVLTSGLVIEHLGYARDWGIVKAKALRNARLLEERLAKHPGDTYARFQLGNTLALLEEYAGAEAVLEPAVASGGLHPSVQASAMNLLAEIAVRRGDCRKASEWAEKSVRLVRKQCLGFWLLAAARIGCEDPAGAIAPLRSLIDGDGTANGPTGLAYDVMPEIDQVLYRIGVCLDAAGERESAVRAFVHLLNDYPGHAAGSAALAVCLGREPFLGAVEDLLAGLRHDTINHPVLLVELAKRERRRGEEGKAHAILMQSAALHPTHPAPYVLAAGWAVDAGELTKAEAVVEEGIDRGVADYGLIRIGLELALQRKDMDTAFRRLERMAASVPAGREDLRERLAVLAGKLSAPRDLRNSA